MKILAWDWKGWGKVGSKPKTIRADKCMLGAQARLTSKGGGALSMAEEKLHRLEEATAKLRSLSAKHMRERARREEEGEGRQTVMRVLRTALAKAERTVATLREESRKHESQEEKKDKIIAELTRELQRRRKDNESAHRDGGKKAAPGGGGAGDVARMAKEIDSLLERQAELEEQALVYQRKLLDLERGTSPGKSLRKDRRTQVLEAQVDRAMGIEQKLVADVVRCEEERRRSEVKVMELEADLVRRSEAYEASLMLARAQNAELREKVETFARERDATAGEKWTGSPEFEIEMRTTMNLRAGCEFEACPSSSQTRANSSFFVLRISRRKISKIQPPELWRPYSPSSLVAQSRFVSCTRKSLA